MTYHWLVLCKIHQREYLKEIKNLISQLKMKKEFYTNLYPKKLNIRNNVKSAMIQEMLFKLHGCMDSEENSVSSICIIPSFNMIPLYPPLNPLVEWSEERGEIPCINVECEWIQHMSLFFKQYDFFLLPGLAPDGYCTICHKIRQEKIDRTKLKLLGPKEVLITK